MKNILLFDFNNLFVIAIGLAMAYMLIEDGERRGKFYSFLSHISQTIRDRALQRKSKGQQSLEAGIARIEFYISKNRLKPETCGALKLVRQKANKVVGRIKNVEEWSTKFSKFHTRNEFLQISAFDCFVYGISIIFVGTLQNKEGIEVGGFLQIMDIGMTILFFHCLAFEFVNTLKHTYLLRPSVFIHGIALLFLMYIAWCNRNDTLFVVGEGWIEILSVFFAFGDFILYFCFNILVNIYVLIYTLVWIYNLNLGKEVQTQKDDINEYKEELDAVDEALKKDTLEDDIIVTPVAGSTKSSIE